MKPYTKEEVQIAEKIAYGHMYSMDFIRFCRPLTVDRRTRIGRLALDIFYRKAGEIDKAAINEKRKYRRNLNKGVYTNYLNNPLIRDYVSNKRFLKNIYPDRLVFLGRNHWAKNETDLRILKVLRNYYV